MVQKCHEPTSRGSIRPNLPVLVATSAARIAARGGGWWSFGEVDPRDDALDSCHVLALAYAVGLPQIGTAHMREQMLEIFDQALGFFHLAVKNSSRSG
jgi:hypothetical protein